MWVDVGLLDRVDEKLGQCAKALRAPDRIPGKGLPQDAVTDIAQAVAEIAPGNTGDEAIGELLAAGQVHYVDDPDRDAERQFSGDAPGFVDVRVEDLSDPTIFDVLEDGYEYLFGGIGQIVSCPDVQAAFCKKFEAFFLRSCRRVER